MSRRHKTMKGGFWNSLTQGFNNAWEKTKQATTDAYSSATGSPTYYKGYSTNPMYSPTYSKGYSTNPTYSPTYSKGYSTNPTYSPRYSRRYMGGKNRRCRIRGTSKLHIVGAKTKRYRRKHMR